MKSAPSLLASLPRVSLACLPTRIQFLSRVSEHASDRTHRLFVKRDDETGSDLSGNKVRKLEFLLADALEKQADIVLTCGGIQSNHCRATAIAARRLGMDSLLFLRGEEPPERDGNLFLDSMVGAEVRFVTAEQYAERRAFMAGEAARLSAQGRRPYLIPEGGSNARGSLGYIAMLEELMAQSVPGDPPRSDVSPGSRVSLGSEVSPGSRVDFPWDHIVCAVGSGGTLAGLVLGAKILGLDARIWGVNVCNDARYFQDSVLEIAAELARSWSTWGISEVGARDRDGDRSSASGRASSPDEAARAPSTSHPDEASRGLSANHPDGGIRAGSMSGGSGSGDADIASTLLTREEIHLLDGYVGPGYAKPYPESLETIRWMARNEGLLLDPVYTGKAFHGMLQEARRGRFRPEERVLFIHTGGVFSLFAYRRELLG